MVKERSKKKLNMGVFIKCPGKEVNKCKKKSQEVFIAMDKSLKKENSLPQMVEISGYLQRELPSQE